MTYKKRARQMGKDYYNYSAAGLVILGPYRAYKSIRSRKSNVRRPKR